VSPVRYPGWDWRDRELDRLRAELAKVKDYAKELQEREHELQEREHALRGLLRDYVAWSEEHPDIWEDHGIPHQACTPETCEDNTRCALGLERIVQCIERLDLVWLERFEDRARALLAPAEEVTNDDSLHREGR